MSVKPPAGPAPIDADAFAAAHRQVLADGTIQFDLPGVDQTPPPDFSAMGPFLQVFFWVAVAAILLFFLYLIAQRFAGAQWRWRRGGAGQQIEADSWRPEAGQARELLGEADALAAEGRFAEAAHLLLFRSIEDIDSRRPELVRPAFTSRDIAALEMLPDRPRSAFARIAMMVERSLFGQRPFAQDDWTACRAAYREFAFADGWRG